MAKPKVELTKKQQAKILKALPLKNVDLLSRKIGVSSHRIRLFLRGLDVQIYQKDTYDLKLDFANKQGFKNVSDAIDSLGKVKFNKQFNELNRN